MGAPMLRFLDGLNETRKAELLRQLRSVWTHDSTVAAHMRFTAIHPFYDGNGRLARLIANLPVLIAGYPPIVIPMECREDYIRAIWAFEDDPADDKPFVNLVRTAWQKSLDLVAEAKCAEAASAEAPRGEAPSGEAASGEATSGEATSPSLQNKDLTSSLTSDEDVASPTDEDVDSLLSTSPQPSFSRK